MVTSFSVQFRLQGYARRYAKWASVRIAKEARNLGINENSGSRFVSHITLFGSAKTADLERVKSEVVRISRHYNLVPFKLGGFGYFRNPYATWVYLNILPSPTLEQFQHELSQSLLRTERLICNTCQPVDRRPNYKLHASLAKCGSGNRDKIEKLLYYASTECSLETYRRLGQSVFIFSRLFNIIKRFIFKAENDGNSNVTLFLLRVTILGERGRIKGEYDIVLRRWLSREQALSKYWYIKTIEKFKKLRS